MSVQTLIHWDQWRAAYNVMTYADHQTFYSHVWAEYPTQAAHSTIHAAKAIEQAMPTEVIELGGWDGLLAQAMLMRYPIHTWGNVEVCAEAATAGHQRHPNYHAHEMDGWYWDEGPWHCDLFVASHVIEHMTAYHLDRTIAATHAKAIYLDAPLADEPYDWTGYIGSHILELGWTGVDEILNQHGYKLQWAEEHRTGPAGGHASNGHARACYYERGGAR